MNKHSTEAIKAGEEAAKAKEEAAKAQEKKEKPACELYNVPATGNFCKTCQRNKKAHSAEAIALGEEEHKKRMEEARLAFEMSKTTIEEREACEEFLPADIGSICQVCQLDMNKHKPEHISAEAREIVEMSLGEDGLLGEEAELEKLIAAEEARLLAEAASS
eukprot:g61673.t1